MYMQASRCVLRIGNMYKLCNSAFLPIRISSVVSLPKNEYESPIVYRTFIKTLNADYRIDSVVDES